MTTETVTYSTVAPDENAAPIAGLETSPSAWNLTNLGAAIILLLLSAALLVSAKRNSIGIDETFYIPAGISYIRQADPRINYEHPPLMKLLAGSTAILAGTRTCTACHSWQTDNEDTFAADFMHPFPGQRVIWLARLPMVAVTLALALSVFLYGRKIGGPKGGLLSLLLFSTYPLILGFGFAVMNDALVTLFTVLTCLGAALVWRKPGINSALFLGGSLGLALLSKYSALILLPFLFVYWAILCLRRDTTRGSLTRAFLRSAAFSLLAAFVLTWGAYAALFRNATSYKFLEHYSFEAHHAFDPGQVHGADRVLLKLGRHPVVDHLVAPVLYYVSGVFFVERHGARPSFLLGHAYYRGTWLYFPVLSLLHSPPGFLAILALASVLLIRKGGRYFESPEVLSLVVFIFLFTAVSLVFPLNIGLRHFMPTLVGLMILSSLVVPAIGSIESSTARKCAYAALIVCAGQVVYTAVSAWPFYLPYSNFMRMNHSDAWISSDSNVDYGFYMPEVHKFAVANRTGTISFVPFHNLYFNIQAYIPESQEWECNGPLPSNRWVVVSAHRLYNPDALGQCNMLWQYRHSDLAGGSMMAFDLSAKLPRLQQLQSDPNP